MKILITGATGLIGQRLTQTLLSQSHHITAFTRSPERATKLLGPQVELLNSLAGLSSLDGFEAVINLAGEPIADKRWTTSQKQVLCESRWQLTEKIAELIKASTYPPSVLISGSAVGYYGDQGQGLVTEESSPHQEFTWQLCSRWETLALAAQSEKTRVCLLRTGVVLSSEGGALAKMVMPFRACVGGPFGDGQQYMPWIHIEDMLNAIQFLLNQPSLEGPFNMVAPTPVRNQQFSIQLAKVLHRPCFMRVPAALVRCLMGESAVLVLGGQQAVPQRLIEAGYQFRYSTLQSALTEVVKS
ncbi:TIGR01777 family oxidoreductase [Rosenbergiella nectarea]|uniref:TIGR01777 family oxidoreductase n=1 Tax=Rosenbergiella nectarea TaxID=988801 RepID=UPI001BD93FC1|nr:TIGR01777 family oxidoreductase [Rosenbergiella nectarea]MBT0730023.1 TIGR01777 family protein [Rosenbergiella nectarea subsp. apis]